MFRKLLLSALCLLPFQGFGISAPELKELLLSTPFSYPLNVHVIPGKKSTIMLGLHGMGDSGSRLAYRLQRVPELEDTIVTFDFPNHEFFYNPVDFQSTAFGTINELLPALYLMKKIAVDGDVSSLSLYGFSAGGGSLINILGILNSSLYNEELKNIGITPADKKKILQAVEKGIVVLDSPLKSMREIVNFHNDFPEFAFVEKRYRENDLEPIESLKKLKGLHLQIVLFFQNPDTMLSNRDDTLFIETLKSVNQGTTCAVVADDGGHNSFHPTLWRTYSNFLQGKCP